MTSRIIKFRAWDKDDKRMIDLTEIAHDSFSICLFHDLCIKGKSRFENKAVIHEYEVMQFTGLLDKNGKEIYQSDWLKVEGGKKELVIWSDEMCGFLTKGENGKDVYYSKVSSKSEVIGNEYEGLLKSGEGDIM